MLSLTRTLGRCCGRIPGQIRGKMGAEAREFPPSSTRLRRYWYRLTRSSLMLALLLITMLLLTGTFVYSAVEGWTPLEALYATVITITTVGYGDYSPKTFVGRVFSIGFTLSAIGAAGYAISSMAAVVIEHKRTRNPRRMERNRMKRISELNEHMIVCGGGIVAHRAANQFLRRDRQFIIVEKDEETLRWALLWMHKGYVEKRRRHFMALETVDMSSVDFSYEEQMSVAELSDELDIPYLLEDPTDDQQLRRAGITRARGLVAALSDDRDNMAVILSARDMANRLNNPQLRIVARIHDEWNTRRFYLAGADKVISPNVSGGIHIANVILNPVVTEFWDHMLYRDSQLIRWNDVELATRPEWVGLTVSECNEQGNELIIAIKRNGEFIYAPDYKERFERDDTIIVISRSDPSGLP